MPNQQPFAADAETMNALVNALGITVLALCETMTAEQKQAFANRLAGMARAAERNGQTTLETLLIDLHRAASM